MKKLVSLFLLLGVILLGVAWWPKNRATIYSGGLIYPKADTEPVEAVVVKDGIFSYVGSLDGAFTVAGRGKYKYVDLQGRMMLPSFFEAHAHPNLAVLFDLRDLPYAGSVPTPEEYVAHIREYLKKHPEMKALRGTGWDNAAFPDTPPNKALLDTISTEIPIFLLSFDQHSAWVNSKALELGKITRDTPGPIEHDASGKPSGTLRDEAALLVHAALPPMSVEENKELILKYQAMAHRMGITGHMNALVLPRDNLYVAYRELHNEGKLAMYTQLAFRVTQETYLDELEWIASEPTDDFLGVRFAKFFMDGAILGQTAYLLEDYATRPGYRGEPLWTVDALRDAFRLCEAKGLRIHVHAVGDGATRLALDGLEAVKTPNRHAITHLILVNPADIVRFHTMDVIATLNPYWFCKSAVFADSELKQLGPERAATMFPAKSFYDAGVKVTAASDYPVSVPNPLIGLEMAVTRTLIPPWRGGRTAEECILNHPEAISKKQALDAFTLSAAYAYGLDAITGSIEPGKSADFILLDKNILQTAPSEAKVLETWFRGKQVYCRLQP